MCIFGNTKFIYKVRNNTKYKKKQPKCYFNATIFIDVHNLCYIDTQLV
jgi:hypothetical protein